MYGLALKEEGAGEKLPEGKGNVQGPWAQKGKVQLGVEHGDFHVRCMGRNEGWYSWESRLKALKMRSRWCPRVGFMLLSTCRGTYSCSELTERLPDATMESFFVNSAAGPSLLCIS